MYCLKETDKLQVIFKNEDEFNNVWAWGVYMCIGCPVPSLTE